ncbi:MAG: YciI family protein [Pseudomonadota bacterium]
MTEADRVASKKVFGGHIRAQEARVFIDTDWLHPAETATTVTLASGERRIQDGPFAETQETLAGFFAIEVENLDEALRLAEKCPAAHYGKVEIRASAMGGGWARRMPRPGRRTSPVPPAES